MTTAARRLADRAHLCDGGFRPRGAGIAGTPADFKLVAGRLAIAQSRSMTAAAFCGRASEIDAQARRRTAQRLRYVACRSAGDRIPFSQNLGSSLSGRAGNA
jgi:hypothetical protein